MNRHLFRIVILSVLPWLVLQGSAFAGTPKEEETKAILRALDEPLDIKDAEDANSSPSLLAFISAKTAARGKEVLFHVNVDAFKKGTTARAILDGEVAVRMPLPLRRMSPAMVLRIMLAQLEDVEATFLVRNGVVEILPAAQATPAFLLQRKVTGAFTRAGLEEVLQALSYQSGATIVLDSRALDLAKTPITATFRNDATLDAALRMVTEMAELKLVVMPGGLFVTTPAHADVLHREAGPLRDSSLLGKAPK